MLAEKNIIISKNRYLDFSFQHAYELADISKNGDFEDFLYNLHQMLRRDVKLYNLMSAAKFYIENDDKASLPIKFSHF
jgi:hypothetical protein